MIGQNGALVAIWATAVAVVLFDGAEAFSLSGKCVRGSISSISLCDSERGSTTRLYGLVKFVKGLLSKDEPEEEGFKLPLTSTAPEDPVSKDTRLFARHNPTEEGMVKEMRIMSSI